MTAANRNQFLLRIPLNTTVPIIYKAFSTPRGLESWFLRSAKFLKPDGANLDADENAGINDVYEWQWFGYNDEVTEKGVITETNNKDSIKFVFGKAGLVQFSIINEDNNNLLKLVQSEIPSDEEADYYEGCMKGWLFYLTNLKSILEGGIDLRNKNIHLKNVINS